MQIRLMFFATLALAIFGLRTCGGYQSSDTIPVPAESCTMVISGPVTAKVPCYAVGAYDPTKNETGLGITMRSPTGSIVTATIAVKVPGYLQNGTFSDANTTSYAAALVSGAQTAPSIWVASPQPKLGTTTITVSSSVQMSVASGNPSAIPSPSGAPPIPAGTTGYMIHGTARATLAPQIGATGTVTITASF